MLDEIRISNFAIIDQLELEFDDGLNVITGETGAGKSIVVDAVELLMGGKTDPSMVRSGSERAIVEGVFIVSSHIFPLVEKILVRENLLDPESPSIVTLSRELRNNGRSSARVNGITVSMNLLQEIGGFLVDIHGQSEHLSLLQSRTHIDLLDGYASLFSKRDEITKVSNKLTKIRDEIATLEKDKDELEERANSLREAIEEIDAAELIPGEEEPLQAERTRHSNSEQLATLTAEASLLLNSDDDGEEHMAAVDQLQQVAVFLDKLAAIDESLAEDAELANSISTQALELSLNLRDYADDVEYDPVRINEIEERLELIKTLRRRYGLTIEHVLEYADSARIELDRIDNSDGRLVELRKQEDRLLHKIGDLCAALSQARLSAGQDLSQRIVTELADLRMDEARFVVNIEQDEDPEGCYIGERRFKFGSKGVDTVEFMLSANLGEPLMPLAKVASGGETARIMLALKRVLTLADPTATLIFDEIDQGIGGRLGSVVGEKLWNLSKNHQVLVVTHLAQLAGFADAHYRVEKQVSNERTITRIELLQADEARTSELAEMLGAMGESGNQTARDLIVAASDYKETN